MNLDDESYLSAYLDDELDPADRLTVEWSVESSAPLAEQLRSIGLARDAVAGLARPAIPRNLAPVLKARFASDRRRARLRSFARPVRVALVASCFSSIAASLIFALILLNHSLHETPERPKLVAEPPVGPAPLLPAPAVDPARPAPPTPREVASIEPAPVPSSPEARPVEAIAPGEARELRDRRTVAGMFERSPVRRVLIVTDVIDAPDQVRGLIQGEARKNPEYGRISICQEIVIDPDRPEAAEVFAVPMDERGRRSFVDRLARLFPNLVEEGESPPELVTQLSEVGQVVVYRGPEAAPLGEPPLGVRPFIANLADKPPGIILEPDLRPIDPARTGTSPPVAQDGPPKSSEVVASKDGGPEFVGPPDLDRKAPLRPDDPVTILVWVTRPNRR
jgi:hypothetical protein